MPPARIDAAFDSFMAEVSSALRSVGLVTDPRTLASQLARRATLSGRGRRGSTSCGGSARLLPTADGWIAVNRARPDDEVLLAPWVGDDACADLPPVDDDDGWRRLTACTTQWSSAELVARAELLGLPVGSVAERLSPWAVPEPAARAASATLRGARVVDLSALWAGPLCCSLLARAGASVIVVDSVGRPDPTRHEHPSFFAELRRDTDVAALDLRSADGRDQLRTLVEQADIVVSSSRQRALDALGLAPSEIVAGTGRPRLWVAITGHGLSSNRVGFGDDAAVAGGLVASEHGEPRFVADAIADPLTGLAAAASVAMAWTQGGDGELIDLSLAGVAARIAGRPATGWTGTSGATPEPWLPAPAGDS